MDATALLTLSFLNLLDEALDVFDTVYIPHSTLTWLFEEKQRAAFHQPSRIRDARQLHSLLAAGVLEQLLPNTVPDFELSTQVGDELALLILEAEKTYDDDIQRIVVRPCPVYRLSSLMEEEADLEAHAAVLSSCQSVVALLRQKGQITTKEEKITLSYLQLHEKPWPNQPEIADGAILYLDGLAINYLLHLGLLEKLKAVGFKLIASPKEISEANELISYECISDKINNDIECIRSAISTRIKSGRIRVGRRRISDEEEQLISSHPTLDLFALVRDCEAILIDDRSINQHANINDGSAHASVFTTLDLLDAMVSIGTITAEERLEYKTRLRRAGYCFVSVNDEELAHQLDASAVKDDKVMETTELKAIRESILFVRMRSWLQIPTEAHWLDELIKSFIRVLIGLWKSGADFSSIRVRSNWIMDQIDIRGWAHSFGNVAGDNVVKTGQGEYIRLLLLPLSGTPQETKDEYWNWLEDTVLAPIEEQFPDLYSQIVEWQRKMIAEWQTQITQEYGNMTNNPYIKAKVVNEALGLTPPLIRKTLLENPDFREENHLIPDADINFVDTNVSVQRSVLYDAVRMFLSGASENNVPDKDGLNWQLEDISEDGQWPILALSRGKQRLILPNLAGLSPDCTTRLRYFDEVAIEVNLPSSAIDAWRNVLLERAFEDDEVEMFHNEILDTPVKKIRSIRSEIISGHRISTSSLVPHSRNYFERLVGAYDGSSSIDNYAVGKGRSFFKQLSQWQPYDGFLLSLFLSSHSALTTEINVDHLSNEELIRAFEFLDKHGDRISQLGAIEIGLRIISSRPEIEPILVRLIEQIRDDDADGKNSGFKLVSALFVLVYGELSRIRLFTSEPPFYRRLAALSQAALIHRQLLNSQVNIDSFCEWAFRTLGTQYYNQSLTDMRSEPRWNPEHAVPSQIKAEFFGRIIIAAMKYEQNIKGKKLYDLILGSNSESLFSLSQFPYLYYPGPLEGTIGHSKIMPVEIFELINKQLSSEEVTPSSFTTLVNSVQIFQVGGNQAELAAKALKLSSYQIANVEDRSQLLAMLNGLATVAAITRSHTLADELRFLVRRYRRNTQYSLSIYEVIRICVVTSSSREGLKEWRDFAGDWLTELAFGDLEGTDGEVLHSYVQFLCHAVPELWVSCGRADAALKAYNARIY